METALGIFLTIILVIIVIAVIANPELGLGCGMLLGVPGFALLLGLGAAESVWGFDSPDWIWYPIAFMCLGGFGLLALGATMDKASD